MMHRTSESFVEEARSALVFMIDNPNAETQETTVHDLAILMAGIFNRGVDSTISRSDSIHDEKLRIFNAMTLNSTGPYATDHPFAPGEQPVFANDGSDPRMAVFNTMSRVMNKGDRMTRLRGLLSRLRGKSGKVGAVLESEVAALKTELDESAQSPDGRL